MIVWKMESWTKNKRRAPRSKWNSTAYGIGCSKVQILDLLLLDLTPEMLFKSFLSLSFPHCVEERWRIQVAVLRDFRDLLLGVPHKAPVLINDIIISCNF